MKIRFLTVADQEVDDAVVWYDEQVDGLGRDSIGRFVWLGYFPKHQRKLNQEFGAASWLASLIP
jgi:hypothetical protein